jgi:hypothetical protein
VTAPGGTRCNPGGRPLSPDDRAVLETFRIWLAMDEADRKLAVRLDPGWQLFVLGLPLTRKQESQA